MSKPRVFVNLAVRVPPEVMESLKRLKAITDKSVNQLTIEALIAYVAALEAQLQDVKPER